MKVGEVPQDKGFLIEGRISDLCYALDENGVYRQATSRGWSPKNDAMKLAWENQYLSAKLNREKVLAGELSPIAFYMVINLMDVDILASYMGISRWRVKRHLKMRVFRKMKDDIIARYADIMGISPDQLKSVEFMKNVNLDGET